MNRWLLTVISAALLAASVLFVASHSARTLSPTVRTVVLYFHWVESPVSAGGTYVHYIMNSSALFQAQNNSLLKPAQPGAPALHVAFYLYPALAANLTVNGYVSVFVWVNASAVKQPVWTLKIGEVDPAGNYYEAWSGNPLIAGGPPDQPPGTVCQSIYCYNLTTTDPVSYTFSEGRNIVIIVDINIGADTALQLWYDSTTYPSQAHFPFEDHIAIPWVATFNETGVLTTQFPSGISQTVVVRANVTDALGGYDVVGANMSILNASGYLVYGPVVMTLKRGSPTSYQTIFEANWTYPDTQLPGTYTVNVTAIDNTGNIVYNDAWTFSIGRVYTLCVQCLDSLNNTLVGARVELSISGTPLYRGETGPRGWFNLTCSEANYTLQVYWHGALVHDAIVNVTGPELVIVYTARCGVYYPALLLLDDHNEPLPGAEVFITFPNGTRDLLPRLSNATGYVQLIQEPAGSYRVEVFWYETLVFNETLLLDRNTPPYEISCAVFYVDLQLVDANNQPLPGPHAVAIVTAPNGTHSAHFATSDGWIRFERTPIGNYSLSVFFKGFPVAERTLLIDNSYEQPNHLTIVCAVYSVEIAAIDANGYALANAPVSLVVPDVGVYETGYTNELGVATFRQVPTYTYTLQVAWKGVVIFTGDLPVTSNIQLTVSCSVYSIELIVVDANNNTVTGAVIQLYHTGAGFLETQVSDYLGRAFFNQMPIGSYSLNVTWKSIRVAETSIDVSSNVYERITCRIYRLAIQTIDANENTLGNATVLIGVLRENRTEILDSGVTDTYGNLVFSQLPATTLQLEVWWRGVRVYTGSFNLSANALLRLYCSVYQLAITAVDANDLPVVGASISVSVYGVGTIESAITDTSGRAILPQIPAATLKLVAYWMGVEVYSGLVVVSENTEVRLACSIYSISCVVENANHRVLPGAFSLLTIQPANVVETRTVSEDGVALFAQVPPGTHHLQIYWLGVLVYDASVEVTTSNVELLCTCQVYDLEVVVQDQAGHPVAGAYVTVVREDGFLAGSGYTDSNGTLLLTSLPRSSYLITVHLRGTYHLTPIERTANTTVTLDNNRTVTLTLPNYPLPFYATNAFKILLGAIISAAAILLLFLYYIRPRYFKKKAEEES